ncbi:MAG: GNAT family N-acetyltransferase [Saprospiraceae bacterium]
MTGRLHFRSLTFEDKEPLMEFFSSPEAIEFFFIRENLDTYIDAWIARQIKRYHEFELGLCGIELRSTGELIGQCGLIWQEVDGVRELEVGYHLLPRFWRQGYATEAAGACRDFAFEHQLAPRLVSLIYPENFKSQAVARRNGMTPWKKTVVQNLPVIVFRLDREQWGQPIPAPPPTAHTLS